MGVEFRLGSLLRQVRRRFYRGRIQQAIQRTGLNSLLSEPFWKLVYHLSDNVQRYEIDGVEVALTTNTFEEFMRFRTFVSEEEILEDLLGSLTEDDVLFDVGAHVGTYSCFGGMKVGHDQVFSFEPEPKNARRLRENLAVNGFDTRVFEIALSDKQGTVELAVAGDEPGEGEHAIATDDDARTIEVPTARGDAIIDRRELPQPTVVKVDVEGAELSVLRGLEETLTENCRLVYVEVHEEKITDFGDEASEVRTFLSNLGFEVREIKQRGSEVFLRASK